MYVDLFRPHLPHKINARVWFPSVSFATCLNPHRGLQPASFTSPSCNSLEPFCQCDLQLSSLCLPPPLVPSLWLKQRSLDPSSSADMTVGDVTSLLSALPYLLLSLSLSGDRLTLRGAWHDRFRCHLTATWPSTTPTPQPVSLPLSCMHSHPLSQTLSGDLLRRRHDRCRCHCTSPCLCLMTSWLTAVRDMTGVDVTYKWASPLPSPL